MLEFTTIKQAVQRQFKKMSSMTLLRVLVSGDLLWETYLKAFPPGSDPMFRKRTDHDCSCCRHFIRDVGGVVCIDNGRLVSLWDIQIPGAYQVVADAMAALVKGCPIENLFLYPNSAVGTDRNLQMLTSDAPVQTWEHFYLRLPSSAIAQKDAIGTRLADARATYDVMLRSLQEIDIGAVDEVLDLIAQKSLYRGDEHKANLVAFRALKAAFLQQPASEHALFCWPRVTELRPAVSRMRNTVIGTLLVDLSEGKELDEAVAAFEQKVAPANYKRPTALVTKAMIQTAKTKVEELGLTSALERRYATLDDIAITDLIFADRETKKRLNATVFDELAPTKHPATKKLDKVEELPIEEFIANVIPTATSLEVLVENSHRNRLVSLVAPCDFTAERLFKWGNPFSWSYTGDFADSIKERVKTAGGKVDGDLRCSLSWFNYDDLDLHMIEPSGYHIYFGRKRSQAGALDVDMNAGGGTTRTPVENICYPSRARMDNGIYTLQVNNYCKRESVDVGFEVEIEFDGHVHTIAYTKALPNRETIVVAKISYRNGQFEIVESLPSVEIGKEVWGIRTCDFVPVSAVMLSPNHWSEAGGIGNKHYFFMLKGCANDGTARGFYNEFLRPELNQHRKVLELVGSKMKTAEASDQLSGLGFSSTQRGHLVCRVKGSFTRVVKVLF